MPLRKAADVLGSGEVAEEELQRAGVAHLDRRDLRVREPVLELLAADVGDRVQASPAAPLLPALLQEPHPHQPLGLRVQLRVREGPEIADRHPHQPFHVVGRGLSEERDQPEDHIRRGCEFAI